MATVEIAKLSYTELLELSKRLDEEIADKRAEELKVLADGYIKKMEAAGFTVAEVIDALKPYAGLRKIQKSASRRAAAVIYRDPANPENTWSGRGRVARWLADYEAKGRLREEFRAS